MASTQDRQPFVEDCSDEDGPVSFQGRNSPTAANVSTKRSHPSDLDKEKPPAVERVPANVDVRSDSGYSSYTAATVSSTNSAPSATSQRSPPVVPATTALAAAHSPAPKARRPTVSEPRQNSANSSPRPKPLSRTASQSQSQRPAVIQRRPTVTKERPERKQHRDRRDSRVDQAEGACTDPNCTECGPNALPAQRRRPDVQPSQSARDVSRLSVVSDQRSMRSDPAAYYASPPSPTYTRQSAYVQGPAIIQPSAAPRRRASSTARQQRPMSYSGEPGAQYWVPGMPAPYASPPQEHGPPPANSAQWRNMPPHYQMPLVAPMGQMGPPMPPYMAPPAPAPGYPQYAPSPYDGVQRPGMPSRNSSNFARNGPPPVITQAPREQQYSVRYGQPQPQSATQPRFPAQLQLQGEAYESESESESESEEEEYEQPDPRYPRARRALMPPPKITRTKSKSKKERPIMPHAKTTQIAEVNSRMSQIIVDERPSRERAPRIYNESARRKSVSRPAAPRQTQSDYVGSGAKILVNRSSKADRRRSDQVYDKSYEDYVQAKEIQERNRADAKAAAEAKALKEAKALAREKAREDTQRKAHEERYQVEQAEQERQRERDRKRQSRNSKVYYQPPAAFDSEDEEEEESEQEEIPIPAPAPPRRRRPTDVDGRKGKERFVEPKVKRTENEAEDYISAQRGSETPFNDQIHRAAKRASRVPSMPSHSGSSGSDRQSQSNRTTMTSNENNEIRLRVDASAPLSLSFNGDMEGRTLRMIPAENGMADIVIGSRNGDSTYQGSERGSVAGDRRSLVPSQAWRQAEEMTDRSVRSNRSRRDDRSVREPRDERDGQQRPLQRRRASTYRE
jgi:hypothetical protein